MLFAFKFFQFSFFLLPEKEEGRLLNLCGITFIQDEFFNNFGSIALADWRNNRNFAFDPMTGEFQRHVIDDVERVLETA